MPKNEDYVVGGSTDRNTASHVAEELRRSFKPQGAGAPTTPAEKIEEALNMVQNSVRAEQMCTEQNLQSSLSKASTHVADSQSIDNLFAITQQLSALVSQGDEALRANSTQASELITQLGAQLAVQQAKSDRQVAMSLQQAVSAMADAQNAMFQAMSISEMQQLVKGAQQTVKDIIAPGQVQ
ncbi:MAG: hypothetical protein ACOX5Q_01630 [Bacillota bacterium]|jgi:hypothetical protein|nr:hypothetical protein [Candidatus Fermentithermobacillaceae bacterium]